MDSAIFYVQETTSTSSDATVTAGITSRRSISLQKPDRSKDIRSLAASFDFTMWGVTEDGGVIALIADANSFKALPDSKLIFVHAS